jgi:spore coat protein CotF
MKHNRSLKEILIPKTHFKDKEESESAWSPRNFQPENCAFNLSKAELKSNKNTQSQKNLLTINPLNTTIVSPKYLVANNPTPTNVLTPANKNVSTQ